MLEDPDACTGSRLPPAFGTTEVGLDGSESGECRACGRRLVLGYARLVPVHRPEQPADEDLSRT
jgi:hypothetical protein